MRHGFCLQEILSLRGKTGRQTGIMTEWEYLAVETQGKKHLTQLILVLKRFKRRRNA